MKATVFKAGVGDCPGQFVEHVPNTIFAYRARLSLERRPNSALSRFYHMPLRFHAYLKSSLFWGLINILANRLKRRPSQREQLQERKCPTFWFQEKRKRKHARHPRWLEGPCFRPHLKVNNKSHWSDFPPWFQRTKTEILPWRRISSGFMASMQALTSCEACERVVQMIFLSFIFGWEIIS